MEKQWQNERYKYCGKLKGNRLLLLIKAIIATWTVCGNPLAGGEAAVVKSELSAVVILLGIGMIIFYTRESVLQKDCYIGALSIFFAISTVIGRSYYELGNWNYVFGGSRQFCLALVVGFGYYLTYSNFALE